MSTAAYYRGPATGRQPRRRSNSAAGDNGFFANTPLWVLLIPAVLLVVVVIVSTLAFVLAPPAQGNALLVGPTAGPTTAASSTATATTTAAVSSTTPATTAGTTSVPTTIPTVYTPLSIVCPANATLPLGSDFDPDETGIPSVTQATGYASNCVPLVNPSYTYSDASAGTFARRQRLVDAKKLKTLAPAPTPDQGTGTPIIVMNSLRRRRVATMQWTRRSDERPRSITAPQAHLDLLEPYVSTAYTNAARPNPSMDVSANHVVSGIHAGTGGTVYTVHSSDLSTELGTFSAALTLAAPTSVCNTSNGVSQVLWDHHAGRWVLMEQPAPPMDNYLCLYVSNTANPLGTYDSYALSFGHLVPAVFPRLGIWGAHTYALTMNATTNNCCVINRTALLSESTLTGFCATPLSGNVHPWTPLSVRSDSPMPPATTINANGAGVGAVFMRHRDDELLQGASTAEFDAIDVEHWSSINFTAGTYLTLRYPVTVQDFDSTPTDIAVPFANYTGHLNVRLQQQRIMHPLVYRNRGAMHERVSLAFTVRTYMGGVERTGIKWVVLAWLQPTMSSAPVWINHEEGLLAAQGSDAGLFYWNPTLAYNNYSSLLIAFNSANATRAPDIAVSYRIHEDEYNTLRNVRHLPFPTAGAAQMSVNANWGAFANAASALGSSRVFYVHAPLVSSTTGNWSSQLFRLSLRGETIARTFLVEDGCNSTQCTQFITLT